jgi:hypothetical protein
VHTRQELSSKNYICGICIFLDWVFFLERERVERGERGRERHVFYSMRYFREIEEGGERERRWEGGERERERERGMYFTQLGIDF